ncbi:MAG: hypothetical protein KAV87_17620 [Desulfobacteraceae bacterium]|nr:hypothetical protein [Desulfobacteraceae bacterium]
MRIEDLRTVQNKNRVRVAATVIWEDCDRPTQEFYFETDEEFARDLSCNPHAFLVACIMPAMRHGEERLSIDAEICPELRHNLITAMRLICHWYDWYGPDRELVRIETKGMSDGRSTPTQERAAFFFSGGIDSLATLRANRLNFPLEHPSSFKDGLVVHGIQPEIDNLFEHVMSSLSFIAKEACITLVPVSTNIRYLYDNWAFWLDEFEGAVFSAVANALSHRITSVTIASSFNVSNLHPHGSHPLLDPQYSSSDLRIRHDDVTISRLDKTKLVADWDVALQRIRVCNRPEPPKNLNCGKCEKCVRTMLALLALDAIDRTRSFPANDVSEELIRSMEELDDTTYPFYPELIGPLAEIGRHDLTRAIESKIALYFLPEWKKNLKKKFRKTLTEPISRLDKTYLNGNLKRFKELLYG